MYKPVVYISFCGSLSRRSLIAQFFPLRYAIFSVMLTSQCCHHFFPCNAMSIPLYPVSIHCSPRVTSLSSSSSSRSPCGPLRHSTMATVDTGVSPDLAVASPRLSRSTRCPSPSEVGLPTSGEVHLYPYGLMCKNIWYESGDMTEQ